MQFKTIVDGISIISVAAVGKLHCYMLCEATAEFKLMQQLLLRFCLHAKKKEVFVGQLFCFVHPRHRLHSHCSQICLLCVDRLDSQHGCTAHI